MLRDLFKKNLIRRSAAEHPVEASPEIPSGIWRTCNHCHAPVYTDDVIRNQYICPKCGGYFRVHARRRIELLADDGFFEEWDADLCGDNPLHFAGYEEKRERVRQKTRLAEAVITGKTRIGGCETALGVMDARFFMGSMGQAVGEKVARLFETARQESLPVVLFCCSGGARMQEGIVSLMQMAKTAAAIKQHSDAGLLYITVLTDPTTGGVTASFAMLGDLILAELGALIGFAGPRVIEQTIGQKLPEGFQRAEFLQEHGFIDQVVPRKEMKARLAALLAFHTGKRPADAWEKPDSRKKANPQTASSKSPKPGSHPDGKASGKREGYEGYSEAYYKEETGSPRSKKKPDSISRKSVLERVSDPVFRKPVLERVSDPVFRKPVQAGTDPEHRLTPWERVQISRRSDRPTGLDYIDSILEGFQELHGDRYFGDDPAIAGGLAWLGSRPITVIAQQKGRNTKENIRRNFGMPSPEGYRKALRLMKQAEKFHRPILCLVDTPGAFCGLEAEERGQGEAIARNLLEMSALKTPILSLVIGEGGSGGALALAVGNEVWMMENAIYSILSPEGFASILWKDAKRAQEASKIMKITAKDLKQLGIIETIIEEQPALTRETLPEIAEDIRRKIEDFLDRMAPFSGEELARKRYERFRRM